MEKDYNTQKTPLILKEYGRNVQKLVEYIAILPSKEERTRYAHTLITLMKQLNPSVREHNDNAQRIWDHLFLMSDFNLDIDSPYPVPERSILHKKPKPMRYNVGEVTYKHYGRNIEILIDKAIKITEPEEKQQAMVFIFKLMKSFYTAWNKETVDDITIANQLRELSKGQLSIDLQAMRSEAQSQGEREHHKDRNRNSNNSNRKKNKDRKRK